MGFHLINKATVTGEKMAEKRNKCLAMVIAHLYEWCITCDIKKMWASHSTFFSFFFLLYNFLVVLNLVEVSERNRNLEIAKLQTQILNIHVTNVLYMRQDSGSCCKDISDSSWSLNSLLRIENTCIKLIFKKN